MKRVAVVVVACLFLCVFSGCFRTVYRGDNLPYAVSMAPSDSSQSFVRHIDESAWNHYFLFGLVPTSKADLDDMIGRLPAGQELRNLKIEHRLTFVNGVIWVLVGGIYNPMTTRVTGDVVQVRGTAS